MWELRNAVPANHEYEDHTKQSVEVQTARHASAVKHVARVRLTAKRSEAALPTLNSKVVPIIIIKNIIF